MSTGPPPADATPDGSDGSATKDPLRYRVLSWVEGRVRRWGALRRFIERHRWLHPVAARGAAVTRTRSVAPLRPQARTVRGLEKELQRARAEIERYRVEAETLAAQHTDQVVAELWRRMESVTARQATEIQRLADAVAALEGAPRAPARGDR